MTASFAAFGLTSTATQSAAPFIIGHGFKKGDVPAGSYITTPDLTNFVAVPLRTWNDGSVKHAALIGRVALTANVLRQINLATTTVGPTAGTLLTAANIQSAAPTSVVTLGSFGTVSLATLLASPVRTFISTKEMVECHYSSVAGSDPSLFVNFHVRLFVDGRMWVRVSVTNGYLDGTEIAQKDYVPSITIGGVQYFDNGGLQYHHFAKTRYDIIGWIGADPAVTPRHDTGYLMRTKLVPNYWKNGTSTAAIQEYAPYQTYKPGDHLTIEPIMGATGFQYQIGLLPRQEAMYFTSQADPILYANVLSHARAINSYGIAWASKTTLSPIRISDYPGYSVYGTDGSGGGPPAAKTQDLSQGLLWEGAHFPSSGYLAYILTADYYHLESCVHTAALIYLSIGTNGYGSVTAGGLGVNRFPGSQMRARGWNYRSIAQAAAITPDAMSAQFGELSTWFANIMANRVSYYVTPNPANKFVGLEDFYGNRNTDGYAPNGTTCLAFAPFEADFLTMSMGMAYDIEPCNAAGMANVNLFRDYVDGFPVWILGDTTPTGFNFGYASAYQLNLRTSTLQAVVQGNVPVSSVSLTSPSGIFSDSFAVRNSDGALVSVDDTSSPYTLNPPNPSTNVLAGQVSGTPVGTHGYWANLLPAIAYAVDHGKAGASASFTRLTGATNFSAQSVQSVYQDDPIFGIVPRSYSQLPLVFTPTGGGAAAPTTISALGHTIRVDHNSLVLGKICVGDRGLGLLGSQIPTTGTNGAAAVFNDLSLPADANKQYRVQVVTPPASGALFVYEDSSYTFTPAADGTVTATLALYEDGINLGNETITITSGTTTPSADTVKPIMSGAIAVSNLTQTGFTITYPAATDNVGVVGYEVSINGGASYLPNGTALSSTQSGLTPSTAYPVAVRAFDLAGNRAAPIALTVTTLQAIVVTPPPAPTPATTRTLTLTLVSPAGTSLGVQTGINWAFFDQPKPGLLSTPSAQGAGASTDVNGILRLTIPSSALAPNGLGYVTISNTIGAANQLPSPFAFSGTVVLP